ncbi:flagellar motor protein MotB [Cellulosilyticum lentocellum]|uniref:OmpA/MotB domain protein n=1 Tax=Cellulosilyticum lentocellum (strain ATCC 49066 / DSM 5427 / NCIMB 11756 / RHM5) TaxID=642492 RepID=F2JK97_CELLD|nr:flagellar motor protein MotB [Cellulosilyticum lentocellum]ADZ85612.1 OmpA/MotB domain protein [Cellulosilyticum lentocellum DSM 5427]
MAKKKPKKENSERWLLTYSDLITLLMIFFVVMYSMSNVDSKKYEELAGSLSNSLGILQGGVGMSNANAAGTDSSIPFHQTISASQEIQTKLKDYLETHDLTEQVSLHVEPQGLTLSFDDNILFDSGKADIQSAYKKNLLEICDILKTFTNDVVVEGHTDNLPIHTSQFSSNWELASIRAINVVHLFIDEGKLPASKLSAISYGEYRPIASNDTPEGRAKNRRIDIILLSSTFYEESQASK